MSRPTLSHFDPVSGKAAMVDVGEKPVTRREAVARASVKISAGLARLLKEGRVEKGDAFTVAKTAAVLAAKDTGRLIPLCHPLPLDVVEVDLTLDETELRVHISATARTQARTGVEMEAMVAASVAALTLYDMCKGADKEMVIEQVYLARKTGGKSGPFHHPLESAP